MTEEGSAARLAFERVEIRRVPGFERGGFELRGLSPGVNLIHGPQAAGKSTTGRVLAGLLWPDDRVGPGSWNEVSVSATARLDGRRWEIDAAHTRPRYQEEGEPRERLPVPGGELSDRYSLALHDLLQAGADDGSFARLISRELAGGFDLDAALGAVGAQEKPGRPKKRIEDFEKAVRACRDAEAHQVELAAEEAQLVRLRAREAAARAASQELEQVKAVLDWIACRERLSTAERALAEGFGSVGAAMQGVTSSDLETLDRLEARLAEVEADLERIREAIRQAEVRLREVELPDDGVPGATLAALEQEHKSLVALEAAIGEGESALARFRRLREDSRRGLEGAPDDEVLRAFPPADWAPFLELAVGVERLRGKRAQLHGLEDWIGVAEPPADLPRLTDGCGRLRRWLRSPASSWRPAAMTLVASGLLAAFGAWGAARVDPRLWTLAALGLALAVWALLSMFRGRADRRGAAHEYGALGLEPPKRWTVEAVEALLARLEARRAEALLEAEKATRFRDVPAQLRRLDEKEAELAGRRRELLAELGLAPAVSGELGDAPLATLAQALCAWRVADAEVRGQEAELAERGAERQRKLAAAVRLLAPFGYPIAETAAALGGQVEELKAREGRREDAREKLQDLAGEEGALRRAERAAEAVRTERDRLFTDRGLAPGDRVGLVRLVEDLPAWREAVERARAVRWDLERAEAALPEREDLRIRQRGDLELLRDALADQAGELESLVGEIRVIEDRARRAKAGTGLEEALAGREEARLALRGERERDADAAVADELGRWLRENLRSRRRPAVMNRASELFAAFTRGRYGLLDPAGEPPALRALETASGLGRSLGELSSGTRLQLLLAVRIAYIEDRERGVRLPLILDETLANSDEWASRAIIEALVELAREGRQVFYLTAQEDEVAKWRAALEAHPDALPCAALDLGEIRRLGDSEARPRSGWRPGEPAVPDPQGRSREEYAEDLGVPGIDPRGEVGAVHLWHLVDEAEVLHGLLAEGIERWGQLRALAAGRGVPDLLGEGEQAERRWHRALARARCVEVLCRSWRQGRGRPVGRGAIVASGAVTDKFLDKVCDLAGELQGAADALVEALRGGAVPRFQKAKIDQLEEYLEAEGHLDLRDPLDEPALRAAALRELAAEIKAGHLSAQQIDELLVRLLG